MQNIPDLRQLVRFGMPSRIAFSGDTRGVRGRDRLQADIAVVPESCKGREGPIPDKS